MVLQLRALLSAVFPVGAFTGVLTCSLRGVTVLCRCLGKGVYCRSWWRSTKKAAAFPGRSEPGAAAFVLAPYDLLIQLATGVNRGSRDPCRHHPPALLTAATLACLAGAKR